MIDYDDEYHLNQIKTEEQGIEYYNKYLRPEFVSVQCGVCGAYINEETKKDHLKCFEIRDRSFDKKTGFYKLTKEVVEEIFK